MSPLESRQVISRELKPDETVLWSGSPDPRRSMTATLPIFLFGIAWMTFNVNFIVTWHSGHSDVSGPGGLFGMQGLLSDLFFVPFILIGIGTLLSPAIAYRVALNTVYAITNHRILIISSGRTSKVQTYLPESLNVLERTEFANGTGTVTFSRSNYRDSDGDARSKDAQFVGISDPRVVEQLLQDTFKVGR